METSTTETYRKTLLPKWIRLFCWLILLATPLVILLNLLSMVGIFDEFEGWSRTQMLGLDSGTAFTPYSLFLFCLVLFFSITAYGLLWGKRWGLLCGILAGMGGAVTVVGTSAYSFSTQAVEHNRLPSELLVQIPFVSVLLKIKRRWETDQLPDELEGTTAPNEDLP